MKRYLFLFTTLIRRFQSDRLLYAASALTYTTLLSLVPLVTVIVAIVSLFKGFNHLTNEVKNFIFTNFVPPAGKAIQQYLQTFTSQTQELSGIGFLTLMVMAILLVRTIERALNDIWHVKHHRRGLTAWLRYWAILTLAPIFLALSIAVTSYIVSAPWIIGAANSVGAKSLLFITAPFALALLGLTLLYVIIPNAKVPWRYGFIGAFIATIFFELAKKAFLFYVVHFSAYQWLYGPLAVIPIFLLWIYLSWIIILTGALITHALINDQVMLSRTQRH